MTDESGGEHIAIFDIVVDSQDLFDLVCDRLWSLGVAAIEDLSADDSGLSIRSSFGLGYSETEEHLTEIFGGVSGLRWSSTLPDLRVVDSWKAFAHPVAVSARLIVVPAWLAVESAFPDERVVLVDPGSTFGMGDHPTTRGCLELIDKYLVAGTTVVDVGCGSGVLGIAALRLGASSALGLDINPSSIRTSTDNARRNRVSDRWEVTLDDVSSVEGTFDLVLANILPSVLIEISSHLLRLMCPGGCLILSGIRTDRLDEVLQAFQPLIVSDLLDGGGWATVLLTSVDKTVDLLFEGE